MPANLKFTHTATFILHPRTSENEKFFAYGNYRSVGHLMQIDTSIVSEIYCHHTFQLRRFVNFTFLKCHDLIIHHRKLTFET